MSGHTDTVTGMELSPDGSYILTTAMDSTGLFFKSVLGFSMEPLVKVSDRCPPGRKPFVHSLVQTSAKFRTTIAVRRSHSVRLLWYTGLD